MTGDESAEVVAAGWYPPAVSDDQRAWIKRHALPAYEMYLAPAKTGELAARVTVLLSHGYVADVPPAVMRGIVADWVKVLDGLPLWAVEDACSRWLAEDRRKPTPSDIRKLAQEFIGEAAEERDRMRVIVNMPAPPNLLCQAMRGKLDPTVIEKWLAPLDVEETEWGIVAHAPTLFVRDWVKNRYGSMLDVALRPRRVAILGKDEATPKVRTAEEDEAAKKRVEELLSGMQKLQHPDE